MKISKPILLSKVKSHQRNWRVPNLTAALCLLCCFSFASQKDCHNPIDVPLSSSESLRFCEIPAGQNILIGSEDGRSDERPVKGRNFHSFHMAQYEVTQKQFRLLMRSEPWKKWNGRLQYCVFEGDDRAANYISFSDAQEFARKLSKIDPQATYRLPTEAEWEYAARGGTRTRFHWGNEAYHPTDLYFYAFFDEYGTYHDTTGYGGGSCGTAPVNTCPVTVDDYTGDSETVNMPSDPGFCGNAYGLMHMSGNAAEWTLDTYEKDYSRAPVDGHTPVKSAIGNHVVRGGWFLDHPWGIRVSGRLEANPRAHTATGIRLVRIPK